MRWQQGVAGVEGNTGNYLELEGDQAFPSTSNVRQGGGYCQALAAISVGTVLPENVIRGERKAVRTKCFTAGGARGETIRLAERTLPQLGRLAATEVFFDLSSFVAEAEEVAICVWLANLAGPIESLVIGERFAAKPRIHAARQGKTRRGNRRYATATTGYRSEKKSEGRIHGVAHL